MSVDRIVDAIIALNPHVGITLDDIPDAKEKLRLAVEQNNPDIQQMVKMVQAVVSGYLGATNLDMHVAAMELITLVSNGGREKGKDFEAFIPEGPGTGDWLCRVIPVAKHRDPAIRLPIKPRLVKPSSPFRA